MTTVIGDLVHPDGTPYVGIVSFAPDPAAKVVAGDLVTGSVVKTTTNEDGELSVVLAPGSYVVSVGKTEKFDITVPDSGTPQDIADLIDEEVTPPVVTTYTIRYGMSTSTSLNGAAIKALSGSKTAASSSGTYNFTVPNGPDQYLYFAWPDAMSYQPSATSGFAVGGIPMAGDLAGSGQGYTQTENGWPYAVVSVDGVDHRVYRTLYAQGNLAGVISIVVTSS